MAQNVVFDEEQKKEVEKELALLALSLLEENMLTPAKGQEFSEYLLDNLEFIEDVEDMLDMLVEIHEDWGVTHKMLVDLIEKYIKLTEGEAESVPAASPSSAPSVSPRPAMDTKKVEDIKSKLASLANLS
ncbi:MAG: hypothetical protein NUV52_02645 [Candidatus Roizmanbacteria bacterium]|nr:hypothetical protein [Candidatus Roizmanbacteria bacterium]